MASGFPLVAGLYLMGDGTAHQIGIDKRRDAHCRQKIAREALLGLDVKGDSRTFHLWLELPERWRSEMFCAAAARKGIAVTPASAFAVTPGYSPSAVRIALASPPYEILASALQELSRLVAGSRDQLE